MACSYSLNINGQVVQFGEGNNNYADLFDFLIAHKNQIEYGLISDIVLSQDTKQAEIVAKLRGIRSEARLREDGVDLTGGDISYTASDGNMSVTDFLEKGRSGDGEGALIQPFNVTNWRGRTVTELMDKEKISREEAHARVDQTLEMWDRIAETGIDIHSMIGDYFAGHYDLEALTKKYGMQYSEAVIKSLYDNLETLKSELYRAHGKGAKIMSQFLVDANTNDGLKLVGSIDLIVVDEEGQPHLYLFKSSTKISNDWDAAKASKYDYQLGFYRQMLASKGIPVRNMELNIIPMKIEGLDEGPLTDVQFEAVQDRKKDTSSAVNRLAWGVGEYYSNISNIIPVRITDETVGHPIKDGVLNTLSKFIPNPKLQSRMDRIDVDSFIQTQVHDSPHPSEGRWYFSDYYNHSKPIYIKDTADKAVNEELRQKVEEYLKKRDRIFAEKRQAFIYDLDKALKGYKPLDQIVPPSGFKTTAFVVSTFQKYVNDPGWEVVDMENLKQMGIIAIHNVITKQVDFVALSKHDLNTIIPLSLGTTMLGDYEKDAYAMNNPWLLRSTSGNIELMKIMAAINEMPEVFGDVFRIGTFKVLNADTSTATIANMRSIRETFNLLAKEAGVTNRLNQVTFMDELEVLKGEFLALMSRPDATPRTQQELNTKVRKALFDINANDKAATADRLEDIAKTLYTSFPTILEKASVEDIMKENSNTGIERFYKAVLGAMLYYRDIPFTQPEKMGRYTRKGAPLSGGMDTNPELIPENNIRQAVKLVRKAFDGVTRKTEEYYYPFFNDYVKALWKDKGYSNARNLVIGDQTKIYDNMFRRNPDGSLNEQMLFANPYDNSTPLSSEERRFLKKILWDINKYRFNLEGKSESDSEVSQLKKQDKWFWVPLQQTNNKILQMGIAKWASQETKDVTMKFKDFWNREENDAYSEEEYTAKSDMITRYEMYNRFNISESSEDARQALLAQYNSDFWERNLESLVTSYVFAAERKDAFDDVLPAIKAIKLLALNYAKETGVDLTVFNETMDNYLKIAVFNQSIISEEGKQLYQAVGPIKRLASFGLLAFNVTGGVRDVFDGMWKNSAMAFSKMYYTGEKFTYKELLQAGAIIMKDGPDFLSRVTKIEALNARMRLADFDMNKLSQRLVSNKSGLSNLSRYTYWFTTAPDYYNRMTMFIAQSLHDGTWDAIEMTKDGLKYDWKKDKRLAAYASGNKSNPDYNKQRGLYLSMMKSFNETEGLNLKEGDALPFAYTQDEVLAIKTLSDLVYGYYDHDGRMQAEKTFMGALLGQFKTFLSATRNAYLLEPKNYGLAGRVQAKNDNGDLLWYKDIVDDNGETKTIVTTENTGVPVETWADRYLEGIFYTLKDAWREFKSGGLKGVRDNIWNEDTGVKKSNLKRLGHDLMLWLLLGALGQYLIRLWAEAREEDRDPLNPTMSRAMEDTVFSLFQRGFTNSFGDVTPINTMLSLVNNSEPVSIGYLSTVFNNTYEFAFGDKTLSQYFMGTTGFGRTFKGATTELKSIAKLAADTVKEDIE